MTTILAIPDYRLQPQGRTVIHFEERPSDQPEAIHSWFYPGDNFGQEFVYPKTRATQLAKQTSRPVLSMPDEQASNAAQMKQAPVKAATPSGEEIEIAEVVVSQPVTAQEATTNPLPNTASSLPLWGLLGLLSLGAGFTLRLATPNPSRHAGGLAVLLWWRRYWRRESEDDNLLMLSEGIGVHRHLDGFRPPTFSADVECAVTHCESESKNDSATKNDSSGASIFSCLRDARP